MNITIPQGTPEYAVDAVGMQVNAWGTKLILGSHRADGNTMDAKLVAALSPQTTKALLLVLKRQVEYFEQKWGPINLPTEVLHNLGEEVG